MLVGARSPAQAARPLVLSSLYRRRWRNKELINGCFLGCCTCWMQEAKLSDANSRSEVVKTKTQDGRVVTHQATQTLDATGCAPQYRGTSLCETTSPCTAPRQSRHCGSVLRPKRAGSIARRRSSREGCRQVALRQTDGHRASREPEVLVLSCTTQYSASLLSICQWAIFKSQFA